jgi:hypothetical protein
MTFFQLPAEVRDLVYSYLIQGTDQNYRVPRAYPATVSMNERLPLALVLTNRQLQHEVQSCYSRVAVIKIRGDGIQCVRTLHLLSACSSLWYLMRSAVIELRGVSSVFTIFEVINIFADPMHDIRFQIGPLIRALKSYPALRKLTLELSVLDGDRHRRNLTRIIGSQAGVQWESSPSSPEYDKWDQVVRSRAQFSLETTNLHACSCELVIVSRPKLSPALLAPT